MQLEVEVTYLVAVSDVGFKYKGQKKFQAHEIHIRSFATALGQHRSGPIWVYISTGNVINR